jgi:hypothetical protein
MNPLDIDKIGEGRNGLFRLARMLSQIQYNFTDERGGYSTVKYLLFLA